MGEQEARYTCMEYRREMVLLGLKLRLSQESLTEGERKAVLEQVRKLEADMSMD